MDKKITKDEFTKIALEEVSNETTKIAEMGGGIASMAVMLSAMSIVHKIADKIFEDNTDTIEIAEKE